MLMGLVIPVMLSMGILIILLIMPGCNDDDAIQKPKPPEYVSEADAREVIIQAFADNNISLETDFPMQINIPVIGNITAIVDGFNDSLNVGYEYVNITEVYDMACPSNAFDSMAAADGPFIRMISPRLTMVEYQGLFRNIIQNFIDSLKVRGII
jgi:hypothetical protein